MLRSFADRQLAIEYEYERSKETRIENLNGVEYVVVKEPDCSGGWPRNQVIRMDHDGVALWEVLTERENNIVDRWGWQIIIATFVAFLAAMFAGIISSSFAAAAIMFGVVTVPWWIRAFRKHNGAYRKLTNEKGALLARFGHPNIDPNDVGSQDEFLKRYVILPPYPSKPISWP